MTNDAMVSEKIDNPRFLRKSEAKVKKAQRALSRKKIGSKNREKAKLILAKKHEKIANQRQDFLHKLSRRIVDENQVIVVETLTSKDMMKNHKVAKSIGDVTWSFYRLALFIEYKAKLEGIKVEHVDPAHTSQTCPSCGERNKAKDRTYVCKCGFKKHRDVVGAMNIRYAPVVDGKSQSA